MQKWRQPALCQCPPSVPNFCPSGRGPWRPSDPQGPPLQPIGCSPTLAAAPKASWAALELAVNFARQPCSPSPPPPPGLGG